MLAKLSKADVQVNVTRFSVDEEGRDQLELKCPECPEQTTLRVGKSTCTFSAGRCTLIMDQPLKLGQNEFELGLVTRDGQVITAEPLLVPVAFRMASSWKGREASPPYGEVVIEAPAGSQIKVDGQAVPAPDGKVTHRITLDEQTLGESRDRQPVSFDVPIEVTTANKVRSTRAALRSAIAPLDLTSVGSVHELAGKPVTITGFTAPGGRVIYGSATAIANDRGEFSLALPAPAPTTGFVEVRADELLTRRVALELAASAALPAERTTAFEDITSPRFVELSATVIESRVVGGVTRSLLEVQAGCERPPCLINAIYPEPRHLVPNRPVKVMGWASPGDPVTVQVTKF
jgi:hypothetical protein